MADELAEHTALPAVARPGVLVADDDSDIRDLLEWALEREGFHVWLAADGQEAVELYRNHADRIHVVLLDVRMPCLDGPQTFGVLQAIRPQVICCFMSGDFGQYTESGLRAQGARAVFHKPFRLPEVSKLLRQAIGDDEIRPVRTAI